MASLAFLFPFLITRIGASGYGFFIFLSTINGIASVANFGFGEATLRYIALYYSKNEWEQIKNTLSTSLIIYIILGTLLGVLIYFFAPAITNILKEKNIDNELAIHLVRVSALTFIIRFIFGIFSTIPQALQRFDISSTVSIFETLMRTVFYVIAVVSGYGLIGLVYGELLLAIIYIMTNYIIATKIFRRVWFFGRFSIVNFREIFSYSIYAALTQIVGLVWQYTDRLLLGYFVGSSAIAYFAVPQQIIFKLLGIISAGAAVLFPKFSSDGITDSIKAVYKDYTELFLIISIVVFSTLSVVMPELLELWISREFAGMSKSIGVLLAVSCMVRGAFPVYQNLFKGLGKPNYNLYIVIVSSLIIVLLDMILIPKMGLNGAGLAYLFSPLPGLIALHLVYKKLLYESTKSQFFTLVVPLLIGYTFLFSSHFLRQNISVQTNWQSLVLLGTLSASILSILVIIYLCWLKGPDWMKAIYTKGYLYILSKSNKFS